MVKNCYSCVHFGELKTPWQRKDGAFIYGYCFCNSLDEKGYAVFLPEGRCKKMSDSYSNRRKNNGLRRILNLERSFAGERLSSQDY